MTVSKRLGLGFALVLALLIAVAVVGISRMSQIQGRLEKIVNVSNAETRLALDMRAIVYDRMVSLRNLTLLNDAGDMEPELAKIADQSKKYAAADEKLSKMGAEDGNVSADKKALLTKLKEAETAAASLPAKAQELGMANNAEAATITLIKKLRPVQKKWLDALDELVTLEDKLNGQTADEAKSAFKAATTLMLVLGALYALGFLLEFGGRAHGWVSHSTNAAMMPSIVNGLSLVACRSFMAECSSSQSHFTIPCRM